SPRALIVTRNPGPGLRSRNSGPESRVTSHELRVTIPGQMNAQNDNPSDRVAVVVVHGIADQSPGQTVRELARLLCHGGEGDPRSIKGEFHKVLVPVEKLEPGSADDTAPDVKVKELARHHPGTPSGFYQQQVSPRPRATAAPAEEKDAPAAP